MDSRLFFVCAISLLLGACASTGTEAPNPTEASTSSASVGNSANPPLEATLDEELGDVDTSATPRTNRMVAGGQDPNELICRRERQTGSKFTVKTCQTRAQLEERARNDQEIMEVYQRKRMCTVSIEGC